MAGLLGGGGGGGGNNGGCGGGLLGGYYYLPLPLLLSHLLSSITYDAGLLS